jgi:hypothetical protein
MNEDSGQEPGGRRQKAGGRSQKSMRQEAGVHSFMILTSGNWLPSDYMLESGAHVKSFHRLRPMKF